MVTRACGRKGRRIQPEPVRYGMIGFGGIAENRLAREGFGLDAARTTPPAEAVLTGVTDVNPERRRAARALGLKWHADAGALLADPDIDAVFVATNNLTHAPLATRALEAGKPVIVEKPLAANGSDARALVRLANKRGLSLTVDHMMVHNALNRKARELIARGTLGAVNDACFHMQFAYGLDPSEASSWRCSKHDEMGGPIGDVASHCFYMMEDLLGTNIHALRTVYYPKRMEIAVEDGALIQCDLESGVTASVMVSFCDRRGGAWGTLGNLGYECYGERGVLRGYGTLFQLSGHPGEPYPIRLELDTPESRRTFRPTPPANIYQEVIREHARSIRSGKRLTGEDGLRNVLLCELAHRSARKGGKTLVLTP